MVVGGHLTSKMINVPVLLKALVVSRAVFPFQLAAHVCPPPVLPSGGGLGTRLPAAMPLRSARREVPAARNAQSRKLQGSPAPRAGEARLFHTSGSVGHI